MLTVVQVALLLLAPQCYIPAGRCVHTGTHSHLVICCAGCCRAAVALLLLAPQVVERTRVSVPAAAKEADPLHPGFVDSGVPVSSADLDPLLWITCPSNLSPSGRCLARRDTSLLLPGTRTRIRMRTGSQPELSLWHRCVALAAEPPACPSPTAGDSPAAVDNSHMQSAPFMVLATCCPGSPSACVANVTQNKAVTTEHDSTSVCAVGCVALPATTWSSKTMRPWCLGVSASQATPTPSTRQAPSARRPTHRSTPPPKPTDLQSEPEERKKVANVAEQATASDLQSEPEDRKDFFKEGRTRG